MGEAAFGAELADAFAELEGEFAIGHREGGGPSGFVAGGRANGFGCRAAAFAAVFLNLKGDLKVYALYAAINIQKVAEV